MWTRWRRVRELGRDLGPARPLPAPPPPPYGSAILRFLDDAFPLIVAINAPRFDDDELRAMTEGYERYFARGERYAVLSLSPRNAQPAGPRERRLIADWANQPRVVSMSKRLCVGAASVVKNPVLRGTLTAILWLWTPPTPFCPAHGLSDGLDFCLGRLAEERIPLGRPASALRLHLLETLRDV